VSRSRAALLLLAASLAVPVGEGSPREENLLRNPDFDVDLSSWQALSSIYGRKPGPGGAAAWFPLDADGNRTSGSLELRTSAVSDRESYAVGQCVDVKRPMDYVTFGGRIRVPPDQTIAGSAELSVETFALPGCAGEGDGHSSLQPIANADFWSRRIDRAMIRGAGSVRLRAVVTKKYEWTEGDESGKRDDKITVRALFDDLFLRFSPDDTDLPEPPREPTTGFSTPEPVGKTSARWGKFTVDPPQLSFEPLPSKDRTPREGSTVVLSSNEDIHVRVVLKHPYRYDDPERYPIEELSVAAENVYKGLLGRPTLELALYRLGDSDRKPVKIRLTSSGGGAVYDAGSDNSVDVRMTGPSEYRTRTLRAVWECLNATLRARSTGAARTPIPRPTDEQLESLPLASMMPLNPPGDYELVARYQALAAGFWHEPVFSAPLRIRIVEKTFDCGAAKP
jgi:hypothetical protein